METPGRAQGNGLIHVAEHDVLGGSHGAVVGNLAKDGHVAVLLCIPALIQDAGSNSHGIGLTGNDLVDGRLDAVQTVIGAIPREMAWSTVMAIILLLTGLTMRDIRTFLPRPILLI